MRRHIHMFVKESVGAREARRECLVVNAGIHLLWALRGAGNFMCVCVCTRRSVHMFVKEIVGARSSERVPGSECWNPSGVGFRRGR